MGLQNTLNCISALGQDFPYMCPEYDHKQSDGENGV